MSVYRIYLNDFKPYLYTTNDYGEHWTLLTDGRNGIPPDHPMHVVREDPEKEGLLYAGTWYGAFVSFDQGKHWQTLQQNLPATPVTDFKVHHGDLVASTMGRSFWIMDDLAPLRQIAASVMKSPSRGRPTIDFGLRRPPDADDAQPVRGRRVVVPGDDRARAHVHQRGEDAGVVAVEIGDPADAGVDRRRRPWHRCLPGAVAVDADAGAEGAVGADQHVARWWRRRWRRRCGRTGLRRDSRWLHLHLSGGGDRRPDAGGRGCRG